MSQFLEGAPIEFKDFSGGLTDNSLQGDPRRYTKADNFLITTDHKLEERSGTIVYDPTGYTLPGNASRVTSLFTNRTETLLFAHAAGHLYTQSPSSFYGTPWTAILGPTGNSALPGGGSYAQLTTAEFQKQIYYTTDEGGQPGKIFKDQNGAWKALTAGLPKTQWTLTYQDNTALVNKCIALANSLRTSLINHINDQAGIGSGTSTVNQHKSTDKYSLSYFVAQSFNPNIDLEIPNPIPVPAPAATDEASLYTLCKALSLAYEHHRNDLAGPAPSTNASSSIPRFYHQDIVFHPTVSFMLGGVVPSQLGINAKLVLSGAISSAQKAASFLDELVQKWYWHQLSPFSHSPDNDFTLMSRYLLTGTNEEAKIGTLYTSAYTMHVTPNYGDFRAFAAFVKKAWNAHSSGVDGSNGNMHGQVDDYGPITLPDPVDFDSAALTIFWARWLYGAIHLPDASIPAHTRVTFNSTAGSANITSVVTTATGAPLTLPVDSWILFPVDTFDDANVRNRRTARVTVSGAGTATLSRTVTAAVAGNVGQYSLSWLHGAYLNGTVSGAGSDVANFSPGTSEPIATGFGAVATDLKGWVASGIEFLQSLGAHELNGNLGASTPASHKQGNQLSNDLTGISTINGNPFFVPTVVTYGWAALYRHTYTVEQNGIIYLVEGAPVFSTSVQTTPGYPVNTVLPSYNASYFLPAMIAQENAAATISGIPTLVNTTLTNYDTGVSVAPLPTLTTALGYAQNLTLELYRTTDGGTTFFHLDSLVNGSVSYSDATNETYARAGEDALATRSVLYTSGGVVANDPPPPAKFTHQFGEFTYYAGITDSGQFFPQRIRQALEGSPDSAPATFFDDLSDDVVGLSSTKTNLIAICKASVFRVEGSFTSTGQGFMRGDRVENSMGGLNARSIVQTEIGVFYAGTDGFYYTDGFQIIKISLELDKTYRALTQSDTQKARIYGAYDRLTRRIWWAMQSEPTARDNDVFFVYYLNYGVKPSGVFTTARTDLSWQPSSAAFFKGELVIGDSRGYLFKTDAYTKTDPIVNTATTPDTWQTTHQPYWFRTCAVDMGTSAHRKWTTRIHMLGENVGNVSIQVNSINDAGAAPDGSNSTLPLAPVQYVRNPRWGDPRVVWGDSSYKCKYDGSMDLWRRMPSRSLRSNLKQIEYKPGNFVVYRSDDFPTGSNVVLDTTNKTATLITPPGYSNIVWPQDIVGYSVSFENDAYVTQYLVTALSTDGRMITFTDAGGALTAPEPGLTLLDSYSADEFHQPNPDYYAGNTGTRHLSGGAVITGGVLQTSGVPATRGIYWGAGAFPTTQYGNSPWVNQGFARFFVQPQYDGAPAVDFENYFVLARGGDGVDGDKNKFALIHATDGTFNVLVGDATGTYAGSINANPVTWSAVPFRWYLFEVKFDYTNAFVELYIDGVRIFHYSFLEDFQTLLIGPRTNEIGFTSHGLNPNVAGGSSVFYVDLTQVYSTFQPVGGWKWQVKGVRKEQKVKITSFDVTTAVIGSNFEGSPDSTGADGEGNNA